MKTSLPENERSRIQALHEYAILDTLEDLAFNDIAKLASFICEAPIALISLVDNDRQWFKARVGLQAQQTPREHAFCAHAILQPQEVMVVNDARLDPRFLQNPLVTGHPGIRFYAGAPLVTPDGQALGTLCVIDSAPREMPTEKIDALRALSRLAMAQLELRHVIGEVGRNAAELRGQLLQTEEQQWKLEAANAGLEALSITDSLTGVKNRRAFDQTLQQALARGSREKKPVSLLIAEIDKFKSYNESFGRPMGDEAIKKVAQTLAAHVRPFDVVARYGGAEFAVILPNTTAYSAVTVGEQLRRAVEDVPWTFSGITISVGVDTAEIEQDGAGLTARADRALYWVKQAGGNQVAHANRFQKQKNPADPSDR